MNNLTMRKLLSLIITLLLPLLFYEASQAANINVLNTEQSEKITARGVLRASQTTEIAAAMTGRLLKANYKPGQYFGSGALLAEFECTRQEAELTAMTRTHQTLSVKYENAAELFKLGAAGELDVTLARSEMQQAAAEANVIKARLKDCIIYAPYAGFVTARHISAFETPQSGQPLYSIQRACALELSVITPSNWMRWMKQGHVFTFTVDETGETFKAKVIRIGAAVDPVSQTIEVTARPLRTPKALVGMSGMASFEVAP